MPAPDLSGARIVQDHGWPELQVDGKPFFVNGGAFDYFGVPHDLWAHSLDRYRELGINTIDLTIPWNWHETSEGEFDFDGRSNPRRDLRGLLRMIADRGFKLIVHAGPQMPPTWRLAGYPEWLVRAPEYGMTAEQLADGAEPPIATEFHRDAGSAAGKWLAHQDFVRARREWLSALAHELAPYDSHKKMSISPQDAWGTATRHDASGPLLFVVVGEFGGDDLSDGSHEPGGANLARYLNALCSDLADGGVEAPCLASLGDLAGSMSAQSAVAGVAAQWIFSPPIARVDTASPPVPTLSAGDAETLALLLDTLDQQPNVPPLITSFHAGGYAAPYENSPARIAASATTLGTRLLLGRGVGGIVYAPLQDSLMPAGYETPGGNRYLNPDVALDIEGERRSQAVAIERNGRLVKAWGERLASAHLRADVGIVDLRAEIARTGIIDAGTPRPARPSTDYGATWQERATRTLEQVMRVAELAERTAEVVNPATQTVERLLRDPVLVLVAPKMESGAEEMLPERAQQALEEYVRRGGVLIAESAGPTLPRLAALWSAPGSELRTESRPGAIRRVYGDGATIEWAQDFYSWIDPGESSAESRARPEAKSAIEEFGRLMDNVGAPAVIHRRDATPPDDALILSELVGHESGGPIGTQGARCIARPLCAAGLLSATNLDPSRVAEANLDVLAPSDTGADGYDGTLHVHVKVPPGESLLLPLHVPLCSASKPGATCSDEIVTSGAELLDVARDKNALVLTFYAPTGAKVSLRLASQPEKVELDDNSVDGQWSPVVHTFDVNILRGAAPDYVRVVKIYLKYTPQVAELPVSPKHPPSTFDVSVLSAMRLPLGQGPSLESSPALILVPREKAMEEKDERLILRTSNRGDATVSFVARLTGPLTATDSVHVNSGDTIFTNMKAVSDPLAPPLWPPGGQLPGELSLSSGDRQLGIPLAFQEVGADGTFHFAFDFERDGSPESVLGNGALRLFLSPRDGGRMLALQSAITGENFITAVGALRDWFLEGDDAEPRDFTFNRAYSAEWIGLDADAPSASAKVSEAASVTDESEITGVRMRYDAPEAGAAGATIEKTVRLIAPATIEASYRVSLKSEDAGLLSSIPIQFVAASSLPAASGEERATEFCWKASVAKAGKGAESDRVRDSEAGCDRFTPLGAPIESPRDASGLEIRTQGRAPLEFEWTAGSVKIVMKSDSVLLEVAIPVTAELPAETTLRYTVGPGL